MCSMQGEVGTNKKWNIPFTKRKLGSLTSKQLDGGKTQGRVLQILSEGFFGVWNFRFRDFFG